MTSRLKGEVPLITGAGHGQGLARRGYSQPKERRSSSEISTETVDAAVDSIRSAPGEAAGTVRDVSSSADVERALKVATSTFGGLDIPSTTTLDAVRGRTVAPRTRVG